MDLDTLTASIGDYTRDAILVTEAEPTSRPGPRILWCNRAFTEITGYTLEEIQGETPRILQGPDTDQATCRAIGDALARWEHVRVEIKNYTKSGESFWVDLSMAPVTDHTGYYRYWVAIQRDITERKERELSLVARFESLKRTEELLRVERDKIAGIAAVAEHAQDLITITDPQFRILWANPAFLRRTGYHADAIIGLTHCDLLDKRPATLGSRDAAIKAVLNDTYGEQEARNTDADGKHYWTEIRISVQRDDAGRAERFVIVERETTERRHHQQALREALATAKTATRAKSQFLANMSHEIRTPMNGIIGMAELLNETRLSPEQQSCARTITDSANALLSIINDILDFSKVEAGKLELTQAPFHLSHLIEDVASLLAAKALEKNLDVLVDDRLAPGRWFLGDAARLRQMLLNLLGNAIKFTTQGHVLIRIEEEADPQGRARAEARAHSSKPRIALSVIDTGIGIAPDQLGRIFNAFEQADSDASRKFEGTGLGLAITRGLAQLMSGTLQVASQPGAGSEFQLALPLEACPAPAAAERLLPDLSGKRAVVLGKPGLALEIESRRLHQLGLETVTLDPDALLGARAAEFGGALTGYDLALVDEGVGRSESEALHAALRRQAGTGLPVLLLTTVDRSLEATELRASGFADVIFKPTRLTPLARSIALALGRDMPSPAVPGTAAGTSTDLDAVSILVAEDNRTNQLVIKRMLAPTGAQLTLCANGSEALAHYKSQRFDAVLMDVSMPVMSGIEATRLIRAFEQEFLLRPCPIIGVTANAMAADREECLGAGMSAFLTKPIRKAELLAQIAASLSLPQAGQAPPKGAHAKADMTADTAAYTAAYTAAKSGEVH